MRKFRDWCLTHYLQLGNFEELIRAKLVFNFSAAFMVVSLLIGVLTSDTGQHYTRFLLVGFTILYMIPIAILRLGKSYRLAAKVFCLTLLLSLIINLYASGPLLHATFPAWFFVVILLSEILLGKNWTRALSAVSIICIAGIWSAQLSHKVYFPPIAPLEPQTDFVITCGVLGLNMLIILYLLSQNRNVQNRLHKDLADQNQQVSLLLSQQRSLNEELQVANIQANSAASAKSSFLSTMSHEIRTPMNAVIGMTSLLIDTPLNDEQKGFVETVRLSGENLLGIINDILDFSKIEAGKMEMEAHPLSLMQAVEDTLDLLSSKAAEKKLELLYFVGPEVPIGINSDLTRLRQILVNLLNNAIKFTEEGEIGVFARKVGQEGIYHEIEFEVRDSGIGIPADRIDRLFQSFSQVDASTTRKYGGTGLGLVISQKLVEMLGGKIWVESEAGTGSSFFFTILAAESDVVPIMPPPPPVHESLLGCQVLIVDDNHTNLQILEKQTQKWGFEPILTHNPLLAKTILEENPGIRMAILDYHMPEMDGVTLAREIRSKYSSDELPLLMLTSLGLSLSQDDRVYIDAYLHKPVRAKQLVSRMEQLLLKDLYSARSSSALPVKKEIELPKLQILLVEDNAINQKVALRILEKIGYQADVAGNGLEALTALEYRPYDLILMDMQMPEMDGIEASEEIRKREPAYKNRPTIIAMTANAFKEDRERCLAAGMDDYLAKPVKKEQLVEKIQHWFVEEAKLES